jgi:hypothetical protein
VKPLSTQQQAVLDTARGLANGTRVAYAQVFTARSLVKLGLGTLTNIAQPGEPRNWVFKVTGGAA